MRIEDFPAVNATLNASSAILLCTGYIFIKRRNVRAHAWTMLSAVLTSSVFLAFYLTYHAMRVRRGITVTRFPQGDLHTAYIAILLSHTVLAVLVLPMVIATLYFAWRRKWRTHRAIARPTFWIWLYVSITGVVVYWMLYRVAPSIHHA